MSPCFIAAIGTSAACADAIVGEDDRPAERRATAAATRAQRERRRRARPSAGRNGRAGSPCAPLSAISRMVGATRSMRVSSVTLPSCIGTLRSTRTSTRLPATSPCRRGCLNAARHGAFQAFAVMPVKAGIQRPHTLEQASRQPGTPAFVGEENLATQISFAIATAVSTMRFEKPHSLSYQESTRTKLAVDHLGLVELESTNGIVIEVDRDLAAGRVIARMPLSGPLLGGRLERLVDLLAAWCRAWRRT